MDNQDLLEVYILILDSLKLKDFIFSRMNKEEYFNSSDKLEELKSLVEEHLSDHTIDQINYQLDRYLVYQEVSSLFNDDAISEFESWERFDDYFSERSIQDERLYMYKNEY